MSDSGGGGGGCAGRVTYDHLMFTQLLVRCYDLAKATNMEHEAQVFARALTQKHDDATFDRRTTPTKLTYLSNRSFSLSTVFDVLLFGAVQFPAIDDTFYEFVCAVAALHEATDRHGDGNKLVQVMSKHGFEFVHSTDPARRGRTVKRATRLLSEPEPASTVERVMQLRKDLGASGVLGTMECWMDEVMWRQMVEKMHCVKQCMSMIFRHTSFQHAVEKFHRRYPEALKAYADKYCTKIEWQPDATPAAQKPVRPCRMVSVTSTSGKLVSVKMHQARVSPERQQKNQRRTPVLETRLSTIQFLLDVGREMRVVGRKGTPSTTEEVFQVYGATLTPSTASQTGSE